MILVNILIHILTLFKGPSTSDLFKTQRIYLVQWGQSHVWHIICKCLYNFSAQVKGFLNTFEKIETYHIWSMNCNQFGGFFGIVKPMMEIRAHLMHLSAKYLEVFHSERRGRRCSFQIFSLWKDFDLATVARFDLISSKREK